MKTKTKFITVAITLIMATGIGVRSYAQNTLATLQDCINTAISNNLSLKASRISTERATILQKTAYSFEPTSIAFTQDPAPGSSPDNSFTISQSFEFPTIYAKRHNVLKAESQLEQIGYNIAQNEVIKEIASNYYKLLYLKDVAGILAKQEVLYKELLALTKSKMDEGEANRLDVIDAEKSLNDNAIKIYSTDIDITNTIADLQRLLNTDNAIQPNEKDLPILSFAEKDMAVISPSSPSVAYYDSKVNALELNKSLQNSQFLPSFSLTLRHQMFIKGFNPYDQERERFEPGNFVGFEIGIAVPILFFEQKANSEVAAKELQIAQLEQADNQMQLQKQYQMYVNEYKKAKFLLDHYLHTGLHHAHEIEELSDAMYKSGEITYLDNIHKLESAIDLRMEYVNALNDYNQSVIMLHYICGTYN
ncbi:MAG: TolC family protein [Ignavibacteria bacterium]|jgi:cobalt-zinc-cadmium resistance protein CzcA|nr:TolC family protein [Ignavibacteria bacterium]